MTKKGVTSGVANPTQKTEAAKLFSPLKQALCLKKYCAWWIEGKCAIIRLMDVLAAQ